MTVPQSQTPAALWHTQQMSILYHTRRKDFCNRLDNIEKALSVGGGMTALTATTTVLPEVLSGDTAKVLWGAAVALIAMYCLLAGIGKKAANSEHHLGQWEALNEKFPSPKDIESKYKEYLTKKAEITGEENRPWLVDACYYDICIREGLPAEQFKRGSSRFCRLLANIR
jgi:hypothetical protein